MNDSEIEKLMSKRKDAINSHDSGEVARITSELARAGVQVISESGNGTLWRRAENLPNNIIKETTCKYCDRPLVSVRRDGTFDLAGQSKLEIAVREKGRRYSVKLDPDNGICLKPLCRIRRLLSAT